MQLHGIPESRRLSTAISRAPAAEIPVLSIETETTTTSSIDDVTSFPFDQSNGYDHEPMTMTVSPSATAHFRGSIPTFHHHKGVSGANAKAQHQLTPDQDVMLMDMYYKTPSLWMTTVAGALGIIVGVVLNKYPVSKDVQLWIGATGDFFNRALECLTLPLIFTSVTICFSNLVFSQKARDVLMRLAIYFVLAALVASCVAAAVAFSFSGLFAVKKEMPPGTATFQFVLRCPNGMFFSKEDECTAESVVDGQVLTASNVTGLPAKLQHSLASTSRAFPDTQSFASQIVLFFTGFFTENIASAFVSVQFLGIIIFSMIIGGTIMAMYDPASGELNHALVLIRQVHFILENILNWLVPYIPLGTLSMMTFSIMRSEISREEMLNSLYFTLAMIVALFANFVCVACMFYMILLRRNPLKFTWYLTPGFIYMLASGNYLSTIPVLIRSLERSRQVSRTMAQFSIYLGACLCLCGTAVFFVVAPIFMAYTSGLEDTITPGRVFGLIVVATASSIGTPLVPGSALTFTCTIWRTVFTSHVPGSFAHVAAMEWVMYRLRQTYNIIVAVFIARIIAEEIDETVEDEEDRACLDQQLGTTRGTHNRLILA